jgi:hypothetical protein
MITYKDGRTLHAGRVLEVWREDYRAMSDVYTYATFALLWTQEGERLKFLVNANFECDTNGGRATVDATPDVLLLEESYQHRIAAERAQREAQQQRAALLASGREARIGRRMRITRGKCKGQEGTVFWLRADRAGVDVTGRKNARGLALDPVWTQRAYLEPVEDAQ